ncbi:MAG TPA: sulfotransferase [Steroidobacteraceae bacterium]|nr:sulfotransferase [Steroidobacteraceae bacterium]
MASGSVDIALAQAQRLLPSSPLAAAEQASEVLKVAPAHPGARLILGSAQGLMGQGAAAVETLSTLAREQPRSAIVHFELGIALANAGDVTRAASALRMAAALKPGWPEAWRKLAESLDLLGDEDGSDAARAHFLRAANSDPALAGAATSLVANDLPQAEAALRIHLTAHPTDVAALRMLAEVVARLRHYADAQRILERCLELAPGFEAARHTYALVLQRQAKSVAALPEIERLLGREPGNLSYRTLQVAILVSLGDYVRAIAVLEAALRIDAHQPRLWMTYGQALKAAERPADSAAAYRHAIVLEPTLGAAYWNLANLKAFRFGSDDIETMRTRLARLDLSPLDRLHFDFALGKALEDERRFEAAFRHYREGNAQRLQLRPYRADATTGFVRRAQSLYTRQFLARHGNSGCMAKDPIFILGLPRSGSTLIEQILAHHSQVEGTLELPDIPAIARDLSGRPGQACGGLYPEVLTQFAPVMLRRLGERFLSSARAQRRTSAPIFIDRMPNNWLHLGLIHLILPNARIIDARRHPMACCFANFKHLFARGQGFSYSLTDLGAYYRDYVDLMTHFDQVLPGRVHRVIYERLVDDTEAEVRRLLDHCGLEFEPACLRPPIYRDSLEHWKHFEPWLAPLASALGPALTHYPGMH